MSVGLKFNVKEQGPGNQGIARLAERVEVVAGLIKARTPVNQAIALYVKREVKDHLIDYNATHTNYLNGPRTNWFNKAANKTSSDFNAQKAIVGISQVGIRLQILGGKVVPGRNSSSFSGKPTRSLAIPAIAEAHGKTPAEFSNLMFIPAKKKGGELVGFLMEVVEGAAHLKGTKAPWDKKGKKGKMPILPFAGTGGHGPGLFGIRRILFWLVKSVTINPHPDVIPTREKLLDAAWNGVNALMNNVKQLKPPTISE